MLAIISSVRKKERKMSLRYRRLFFTILSILDPTKNQFFWKRRSKGETAETSALKSHEGLKVSSSHLKSREISSGLLKFFEISRKFKVSVVESLEVLNLLFSFFQIL
jgi:hypothetical protein